MLTGNIINPADISGDIIVKFVTNAVTAIMTRLQSKLTRYNHCLAITYCTGSFIHGMNISRMMILVNIRNFIFTNLLAS